MAKKLRKVKPKNTDKNVILNEEPYKIEPIQEKVEIEEKIKKTETSTDIFLSLRKLESISENPTQNKKCKKNNLKFTF